MDLDLRDTGATIIIGLYSLLVIALLVQMVWGTTLAYWPRVSTALGTFALPVVVGLLSFGIGVIVEDLSNKLVDDDAVDSWMFLEPEGALRAHALFGKNARVHELAIDSAELGLLAEHAGKKGRDIEVRLLKEPRLNRDQLPPKDLEEVANALYYQAKNTVYQHTNYFTELRAIQTRIDFARSVSTVSFYSFLAIVIALCLRGLVAFGIGVFRTIDSLPAVFRARNGHHNPLKQILSILRAEVYSAMAWHVRPRYTLLLFIAFISVSWLAAHAYAFEEIEFDKRVFGYLRTLATNAPRRPLVRNGYSGMAIVDANSFLVVHDTKGNGIGARAGLLIVEKDLPVYEIPLEVDWPLSEPLPNDLEGVCAVPRTTRQFVLMESGSYGDEGSRPRRAFVVTLQNRPIWKAVVDAVIHISIDAPNKEIEGISCVSWQGKLILALAERGEVGKTNDKRALQATSSIYWGELDIAAHSFQSLGAMQFGIKTDQVQTRGEARACSDLFLDQSGALWSVATVDNGDVGPFVSVLYQAGTLTKDATEPFSLIAESAPHATMVGIKAEGLGAPTQILPNSRFSIVTDDEHFGGFWRPVE